MGYEDLTQRRARREDAQKPLTLRLRVLRVFALLIGIWRFNLIVE